MIGNSLPEYLFIRTSIIALRLVAPASILYLAISVWNALFPISPWLGIVAIAEAGFFSVFYLPRKKRLQAPPLHPPPPLTKAQRQHFFEKCSCDLELINRLFDSPYPNGWFLPRDQEFQREDAIDWLLWSLFACERQHAKDEWAEELDGYIHAIEGMIGRKLKDGRGNGIKSMRLTLDRVKVVHRPLIWYTIVGLVDTYSTITLSFLGFQHFSSPEWFQMFPPRPLLCFISQRAVTLDLPYWYRPHASKSKLPIIFIHGIGIGLYTYIPLIREIIAIDPDVGILLIELPFITMHITSSPPPPRLFILKALDMILTSLHISRFVLASHSYGTFISAYLVRPPTSLDPDETKLHHTLASKVAHALLIDPVPILLHLHPVAYNFLYRTPRTAAEWQLWYFASSDPDVARTLHRAFFWEESCLWKDDLVRFVCSEEMDVGCNGIGNEDGNGNVSRKTSRNLAISLAGSDQIVPAETVRRYLIGEPQPSARWIGRAVPHQFRFDKIDDDDEGGGPGEKIAREKLEVLFYPELDHAMVFDTRERRGPILDVLLRFVRDSD